MSSQADLINAVSTVLITEATTIAIFVFVVYDWLISLDEEIRCFWDFSKGRRQIVATLLYGFSRYTIIVGMVLAVQSGSPLSDMGCKINFYVQTMLNVPIVAAPAMFTAIRIYALSQNNKAMAISIFALLLGPHLAVMVVNAASHLAELPSPFNCSVVEAPIPLGASVRLTVATNMLNIAGDIIALIVTWRKTYTTYRAQQGVLRGPSLMRVMLYNGSIYFLVITSANIVNMVLFQTSSGNAEYTNILTTPLSTVLTCRFLLDLRQADRSANSSPSLMTVSSLNFDGVGGSQNGTQRSLPAFVASMGSEVSTGLDFVDSIAINPDAANEEGSREAEGLP